MLMAQRPDMIPPIEKDGVDFLVGYLDDASASPSDAGARKRPGKEQLAIDGVVKLHRDRQAGCVKPGRGR
jgi:hypothetical protein